MKTVITPEEGAELKRLYGELAAANAKACNALLEDGMDSQAFLQADREAGRLTRRIREILGTSGTRWMA